jgi:bacterial/archaeal transporter family protein
MTHWLPAALLALLSFGLWGVFTKLAIAYIDAKSALLYQTAGVLLITLVMIGMINFKPTMDVKGLSFGLLTGMAYGLGCLFYFIAVDKGKVITIVTLTALYPLVTIVISYFLFHETVNLKQCLGIILALVAIFLLSS